jgi:hypothetical protein
LRAEESELGYCSQIAKLTAEGSGSSSQEASYGVMSMMPLIWAKIGYIEAFLLLNTVPLAQIRGGKM